MVLKIFPGWLQLHKQKKNIKNTLFCDNGCKMQLNKNSFNFEQLQIDTRSSKNNVEEKLERNGQKWGITSQKPLTPMKEMWGHSIIY